jgi:hypothetical protein
MSVALLSPPVRAPRRTDPERAARRDLRHQIALLEGQLTDLVIELEAAVTAPRPSPAGPRLLDLAALERRRDELAALVARARRHLARRREPEAAARRTLEAMIADPARYRFARVSAAEIGEGGCGVYQVRPRLGLVGMLAGWWEVKLSSGCPLAGAGPQLRPEPAARRA